MNLSEKETKRLIEKYKEAITDIEEWGVYASDYFKEKWKLQETIDHHKIDLAFFIKQSDHRTRTNEPH